MSSQPRRDEDLVVILWVDVICALIVSMATVLCVLCGLHAEGS